MVAIHKMAAIFFDSQAERPWITRIARFFK